MKTKLWISYDLGFRGDYEGIIGLEVFCLKD
jgi:hypothetical protein